MARRLGHFGLVPGSTLALAKDYRLIMWRFFKLDLLEFISSELS